jgi:hypothetical protein
MNNKVHRPIAIKKQDVKKYYITLLYKSIFVLAILLVLLLIKKINSTCTNNVVEVIKRNINYEFNIVDDGKKIFYKAEDIFDNLIKSINVFNINTPKYIAPLSGTVYRKFDKDKSTGIEIQTEEDKPSSIVNGTIERIEKIDKKGYFVTIKKDNYKFIYGYLSSLNVKEGDKVDVGDTIGILGTNKDGKKYLRFEILLDEEAVNPLNYIDL